MVTQSPSPYDSPYESDSAFLLFNNKAAYSPDRMQSEDVRSESKVKHKKFCSGSVFDRDEE